MTALELPCTDYILLLMYIHGAADTKNHNEDKKLLCHLKEMSLKLKQTCTLLPTFIDNTSDIIITGELELEGKVKPLCYN